MQPVSERKSPRITPRTGPLVHVASNEPAAPQLFLVIEAARPLAGGARYSLAGVERVIVGCGGSRRAYRYHQDGGSILRIEVPDPKMRTSHVRLERVSRGWAWTDDSTHSAVLNGGRPARVALSDGDLLEFGQTLFRFRLAVPTPSSSAADLEASELRGLPGTLSILSPCLGRDLDRLERVARSPLTVLIEGETGTGKEVLARAIHARSGRKGPFVAVNCGALPSGLVESLLFGHKRGAFSGAFREERGLVRAAEAGTLFLDEVADLPASAQAALLRVLQEREVVPLGATRPIPIDVRVIGATHRSLEKQVRAGHFRQDLFARLAEFAYQVPPLRERIEDIGCLVASLLPKVAGERARSLSLSLAAARELVEHPWPLNVRELEHRLKLSVLLTDGECIDVVGRNGSRRDQKSVQRAAVSSTPLSTDDKRLRDDLLVKMTEHRGNVTQVAFAMGKARRQVQRWVARFGIDASSFR